ncbi:unnamed protein product [Schistosoma curassoni]|uniref:CA domain-containing protein n=1 Tax=Schistosoma curassoni TaxID=6186 RepID=A0A183JCR0_9TREM|nr:unnamed protein product [Schistosoma curassoni]
MSYPLPTLFPNLLFSWKLVCSLPQNVAIDVIRPTEIQFFIAKDGQIYLGRSKLDRELYPLYELTVRVEDQGTPKLSSTTIVLIHILDVNDNTPQFIFPSIGNNTVYVRKETK